MSKMEKKLLTRGQVMLARHSKNAHYVKQEKQIKKQPSRTLNTIHNLERMEIFKKKIR